MGVAPITLCAVALRNFLSYPLTSCTGIISTTASVVGDRSGGDLAVGVADTEKACFMCMPDVVVLLSQLWRLGVLYSYEGLVCAIQL